MKKILFICVKDSVFYNPIYNALENYGLEVHSVDWRGNLFLGRKSIIHRLSEKTPFRTNIRELGDKLVNYNVIKAMDKVKPDYVLAMKAKNIYLSTLEIMRQKAITINWYADVLDNWNTWQKIVTYYDYMFNYDSYLVDILNKQGHNHVHQLPWAGAIQRNSSLEEVKKDYEISFIGSYHPDRFPRVNLLKGLKNLGLNIWGNKAWLETELKDCYRGFLEPDPKNIKDIYKRSKIAIYLDSIYDVKCSGITLRPFEITAAGTMMLGQVFREELFDFFEDGKEFVSFKETDDLISKARHFLNNEEDRKKIARNGFERLKKDHTYDDRINKMFEIILDDQSKRKQ